MVIECSSTLADTAARRLRAGDLSAQEAARTRIEAERARADVHSAQLEQQQATQAMQVGRAVALAVLLHRRLFETRIRINSKTSDIVLLVLLWLQLVALQMPACIYQPLRMKWEFLSH